MRVLYIVPYAPFGKSVGPQGPKNFSANILRYLSKNITLDLIIICNDDIELIRESVWEYIPDARSIKVYASVKGWRQKIAALRWGLKGYPLALGRNVNKIVQNKLMSDYKEYDLIHFDYYNTIIYRKYFPSFYPCIITPHDAYSLLYRRAAENCGGIKCYIGRTIRQWFFQRLESDYFKCFNRVLTVSPVDRDYLANNGLTNVGSIPIPVQDSYLAYEKLDNSASMLKEEKQAVKLLLSVPLTVDWCIRDARLFVEEGLKRIQSYYPGLEIVFWGKGAETLRSLLEDYKNVTIIEYVRDYEKFMKQNWIFVYTRKAGAGLHTKVQEAMAFGLPIVGYSDILDAFNGENGVHYYSVKTNSELIEKICRLLDSREDRDEFSKNAKMLAIQQFNLASVGRTLLENYTQIINEFTLSH